MTIREVANQLFDLSVGGFFNGEKFTRKELNNYISSMFRSPSTLKLNNSVVMTIALPDREWLFTINKYANSADGFDYTIPETEAQEAVIWEKLIS